MVTSKDFYDLARQWADTNTGYNNGWGYQCIGLIDGLNRALGAGLSTYVRNDEAKNYGHRAVRTCGPGHRVLDIRHRDAQGAHDVSGISAFDREKLRLREMRK